MRNPPPKDLDHDPQAVTKARDAAGMSKYALAKHLGCSRSLITEIEGGTRNADEERIQQLAKVLRCPPAQLRRKPAGEPRGQATEATDVDVPGVQGGQRAVAEDVLERQPAPEAAQEVK